MRKLLLVLLMPLAVFASDETDAPIFKGVTHHRPSYFIAGNQQDQIKSQLSFKYQIFQPKNLGIYLGYTQILWWRLYDSQNSYPITELNYNPELFWRYNLNVWTFKYIQLTPEEHKSNGHPVDTGDRSSDRAGFSFANEFAFKHVLFTTQVKIYKLYNLPTGNKDLDDYIGGGDYRLGIEPKFLENSIINYTELSARVVAGTDFKKSGREYGIRFRTTLLDIAPIWYLQLWDGYAEGLLDYNVNHRAIRFGLIFH